MSVSPAGSGIDESAPASPAAALLGDVAWRAQDRAVRLLLAAIGHVLRQQPWARDKLRMHAGRAIRVGIDAAPAAGLPAPQLLASIDSQGYLQPADPGAEPAATLLLRPSADAMFGMIREGAQGLSRHLRVEGDVMLAATLGELAQHLRWDAEEDLSKLVGDALAHRLAQFGRLGFARAAELRGRVESSAARFADTDQQPLTTRRQLQALREGIAALDMQLQALEARAARLRAG
jgi:ubiquinone biosynthesis protein UbiJ